MPPVSVLHVSAQDAGGGSARSAYRLHAGLRAAGHTSRMLVGERRTGDPDVRVLKRGDAWRAADRAAGALANALSLQDLAYPSSFGVASDPWFREADVLQLFNLHGSYFSVAALPLLSRRRPVVWRLSDMWALTGHCSYSFECERWRLGCGACPHLDVYPRLDRDTTALLWRWKRAVYARSRITVVAPSRWLESVARESPLLGRFDVRRIPNGVDLDTYAPTPKAEARALLGLDPARPLVLFSAPDLSDPRKGGVVLAEALGRLADIELDLLVSGGNTVDLPRPAHLLGRVDDERRLALSYAAADVFVLPTLADNLPNAVLESIASGTPVVSFAVGGVVDGVRHLETGWLARTGDAAGLADGVRALLTDPELRARLSREARATAERDFPERLEVERFADLYAELAA